MDDVIYRKDAIRVLNAKCKNAFNLTCGEEDCACAEYIALRDLPSAQKKGHWVQNDNGTWSCSKCQSWIPNEQHYYARFCLHCGADMRGDEDG